jgi:hypothetical protein
VAGLASLEMPAGPLRPAEPAEAVGGRISARGQESAARRSTAILAVPQPGSLCYRFWDKL